MYWNRFDNTACLEFFPKKKFHQAFIIQTFVLPSKPNKQYFRLTLYTYIFLLLWIHLTQFQSNQLKHAYTLYPTLLEFLPTYRKSLTTWLSLCELIRKHLPGFLVAQIRDNSTSSPMLGNKRGEKTNIRLISICKNSKIHNKEIFKTWNLKLSCQYMCYSSVISNIFQLLCHQRKRWKKIK